MEQEDEQRISDAPVAQAGLQARLSDSATVAAPLAATEDGVIGQQQWAAIHERSRTGQSVSAIARDMGLDRKTVRAALRRAVWQPYSRQEPPGMVSPHMADVRVHQLALCDAVREAA